MNQDLQAAHQARKNIEQVRRHLLHPTPESLDACNEPLCEAIGSLERLESSLREGSPGGHSLKKEIYSLRGEMFTVTTLLKSAGSFYEGLGALLGQGPEPIEVQYNPAQARTVVTDHRFTVHG